MLRSRYAPCVALMRSTSRLRAAFGRTLERIGKGHMIGRAVALDHDALQAEQAGAVVAARIEALLEGVEHRHGNQRGQFGERGCG